MQHRPLEPAEREAIAARYGVPVATLPLVTVVPRGASAFDPVTGEHWQEQRNKGHRILERRRKFAALNARLEADKRAEALHEQREREKAARIIAQAEARTKKAKAKQEKAEARRRALKSVSKARAERRAHAAARAVVQAADDARWLEMVLSGVGHCEAARRIGAGQHPTSIARRLRRQGHDVPYMTLAEALARGRKPRGVGKKTAARDDQWADLVRSGMTHAQAAHHLDMHGKGALNDVRSRLRRRGCEVPPNVMPEPDWWAEARALRAEGVSVLGIGKRLGKAASTVAHALDRSS